jgi:hypothetical protein
MIARGFKPVGWVAAVGGAALGCYMLSLNVAAERAELTKIERQIVAAKQDIRALQTELGTRGRLAQLEQWNAEVLALSAPASRQFLQSEFTLASFTAPQPSVDERAAKVRMASAEAAAPRPVPEAAIATGFEPNDAAVAPKPLVRQASLMVTEKALPQAKPPVSKPVLVRTSASAAAPVKSAAKAPPVAKPAKAPAQAASFIDDSVLAEIGTVARTEKKGNGSTR